MNTDNRLTSSSMTMLAGLAAFAVPIVLDAQSAEAGTIYCGARPDVVELLASDFREQTSSVGVTGDGRLLEVLTNEDAATWSILLTDNRGQSCIVATGEGWQNRKVDPVMLEPQLQGRSIMTIANFEAPAKDEPRDADWRATATWYPAA